MSARNYFWLRDRVLSLLDAPAQVTYDPHGGHHIMHGTRIGASLEPPA